MMVVEWMERLVGMRRVTVQENQRVLALNKGRFMGILAGERTKHLADG